MDEKLAWEALIRTLAAIEEAIRESGPDGVPEGHLYAALSGAGVTLDRWGTLKEALLMTGRVRELPGPRLAWTGGGAS